MPFTDTHLHPAYPLRVPNEIKDRWKEKAKKKRMSLNQWIILMVEEAENFTEQ